MTEEDRVDKLEAKVAERGERIKKLEERLSDLEDTVEDNRFQAEKKIAETNKRVTDLEAMGKVDALDLEHQISEIERYLISEKNPDDASVSIKRAVALMRNFRKIAKKTPNGHVINMRSDPVAEEIEDELDENKTLDPTQVHRALDELDKNENDLLNGKAYTRTGNNQSRELVIPDTDDIFWNKDEFRAELRERAQAGEDDF